MLYQDYRKIAKTGDMILMSGYGGISEAIKFVCSSRWSHIGMVIVTDADIVLLWESTTMSQLVDRDTGTNHKGVQVVELSRRLVGYSGYAVVRRLNTPLSPEQLHRLHLMRREFKGVDYEKNYGELIKARYDGPGGRNVPDLRTVFCSELFAESLKVLEILKTGLPSNEFMPCDFGHGSTTDVNIRQNSINWYNEEFPI